MALTVETGAGLTDADAFISVNDFETYCTRRGTSLTGYTQDEIETAIVRATEYLSALPWQGIRKYGRNSTHGAQALAWPRQAVVDAEGWSVDDDIVPPEVVKATAEVAIREIADPGCMSPDVVPAERIKAETYGSVSFEYDTSSSDASSFVPVIQTLARLIGQFIGGPGSSLVGAAYRG